MKFKLNLVTLALIANAGLATTAMAAGGYGIHNANTDKVKFDKWSCKRCVVEKGVSGSVGLGVGYNDSDDIRSANTFMTEDEVSGKLDADINYIGDKGVRTTLDAENLGMEDGRFELNAGRVGRYNLNLNYAQIATYQTDSAMTPYQGVGSSNLTLADDWVPAGATQNMTQLYPSLNPTELSLKRKRAGVGLEYQGESLWSTHIDFQREFKTGQQQTSGSFNDQSMMLSKPVDQTTDLLSAGIQFRDSNWYTALNYNGSIFKNNETTLSYQNAFQPSFGAQTTGYQSLDPNNEAHTLSLSGQYNIGKTVVSGRAYYGQMTQDQNFNSSGYGYPLPSESLDGQVNTIGANLKVSTRLSSSVRLNASYDYNDRDNQTEVQEWTQISIDNVNGTAAYNTPYDSTTQRGKLGVDYRISRGMKLDGGYDYKQDKRSYQDRETTDEHTLWAKFRFNPLQNWDMWLKGSYGERDGSTYMTSDETNDLLRKYNLADRKRSMAEARVTHSPLDSFSLDFGARYALDDYNETQIGLTESENLSYDINATYMINPDMTLIAFYNRQNIDSEQLGSSSGGTPNWQGVVADEIKLIGAGFSYDNLMEQKLRLGIDYTYSDSNSNTQVKQGLTGDYGDYFAETHNVNLYGQYLATEAMSLRLDYKMEAYQDNDAANEIAPDGIWNVLSFGPNSHDYDAHFVMLSVSYQL